jgi:PKD repeat protein
VELNTSSLELNVTSDPDYFGEANCNITAQDPGDDDIFDNGDDNYVKSNDFKIIVNPKDDAPVFIDVNGELVTAGVNYTFDATEDTPFSLLFNVTDIDGDEVTIEGDVTYFAYDEMYINYTPTQDDVGTIYLEVIAKELNASQLESNLTVVITVANLNDDPHVTSVHVTGEAMPVKHVFGRFMQIEALEDQETNWTVNYLDPDDDVCTFNINYTNPRFFIDEDSGNCSFAPVQDDVGFHYMNITVDDGNGGKNHSCLKVEVLNVNDPPLNKNFSYEVEDVVNVTFTAKEGFDEDGDVLTYTWDFGDGSDTETGMELLHSYPKMNVTVNYTVSLSVSDGTVETEPMFQLVMIEAIPDEEDNITGKGDDDIYEPPDDDPETGGTAFSKAGLIGLIVGIAVILVIVVIVIVLVAVMVRRRKGADVPTDEMPSPDIGAEAGGVPEEPQVEGPPMEQEYQADAGAYEQPVADQAVQDREEAAAVQPEGVEAGSGGGMMEPGQESIPPETQVPEMANEEQEPLPEVTSTPESVEAGSGGGMMEPGGEQEPQIEPTTAQDLD